MMVGHQTGCLANVLQELWKVMSPDWPDSWWRATQSTGIRHQGKVVSMGVERKSFVCNLNCSETTRDNESHP